jgi:hypothetical protein
MSLLLRYYASLLELKSVTSRLTGEKEKPSYPKDWIHSGNHVYVPLAVKDHPAIPFATTSTPFAQATPKSPTEQSTKKARRRGRQPTNPLTPEQIEALNRSVDPLVGPDWGKDDIAQAMKVHVCTVHRILQGKGDYKTRSSFASVLATRHSAGFTFENLLDPAFDLKNFRLRPETPDKA